MTTTRAENEKSHIMEPLEAISNISSIINTLQEIGSLLNKIMDIALETLKAERGFILLLTDEGDFKIKTARNITDNGAMDLTKISNSAIHQALKTAEPIISFDVQTDNRFIGSESIMAQEIKSIASVPLSIKQRPIGVIYLDSVHRRSEFNEKSIPFLKAFAHQAAIAIENTQLYESLRSENRLLRKQIQEKNQFKEIIGSSPAMVRIFDILNSIVDSDATVLISGDSGTGKELIAKALHYNGPRKNNPFMALFCGSLPESLLESELFGHKKGAFTGANTDKKGLFEIAHQGTFFLDEVSELSPNIQVQLLRVLQEGEIKRVGETAIRKVDIRIIAATNKNLLDEVKNGNFRKDLYYRLNVININLPRLQDRGRDIIFLAHHFLDKAILKYKKDIKGFTEKAIDTLNNYSWPGNVRELQNTIERAIVMAKSELITVEDLQLPDNDIQLPIGMKLKDFEEQIVKKTLSDTNNNISETAKILGVSRRWLHYRIKEWKNENDW